jgi:S-adenosyl methyltransferase
MVSGSATLSEKGIEMTTDEAAAPGDGKSGSLTFDTSVAHQARMYDYVLGGCFT